MRLISALLCGGLSRKLGQNNIERAFTRLAGSEMPRVKGQYDGTVQAAALQVEARVYKNLFEFVADTDAYMRSAAESKSELVCFPELFSLTLLTVLFPVRLALRFLPRFDGGGETGKKEPADLGFLFPLFERLWDGYISIMARFAKRYGVWLACGTGLVPDNGRLFNRHVLLSPDGETAAVHDKLHPMLEERALGICAGERLEIADTPVGRAALLVCMDATYFETFRAAKNLGADYAIVPIGDMAEYNPFLALRGAQSRVDETGLAAIKPALVSGEGFPVTFSGRAGIYFPLCSGQKNVETDTPLRGVACAKMDIEALRAARSDIFCRRNKAFDKYYIDILLKRCNEGEKK